jgi:hypothetical protein
MQAEMLEIITDVGHDKQIVRRQDPQQFGLQNTFMQIRFVHLSDLHFGQEKGSQLTIRDDVKERLIEDARRRGGL